jgi:hypothetical protein
MVDANKEVEYCRQQQLRQIARLNDAAFEQQSVRFGIDQWFMEELLIMEELNANVAGKE